MQKKTRFCFPFMLLPSLHHDIKINKLIRLTLKTRCGLLLLLQFFALLPLLFRDIPGEYRASCRRAIYHNKKKKFISNPGHVSVHLISGALGEAGFFFSEGTTPKKGSCFSCFALSDLSLIFLGLIFIIFQRLNRALEVMNGVEKFVFFSILFIYCGKT